MNVYLVTVMRAYPRKHRQQRSHKQLKKKYYREITIKLWKINEHVLKTKLSISYDAQEFTH